MNCYFKILIASFLFTNSIGAQETTTSQNQTSTLQLEKPLINQTKKLALLLPFNLAKVQSDTVNTIADLSLIHI